MRITIPHNDTYHFSASCWVIEIAEITKLFKSMEVPDTRKNDLEFRTGQCPD